jgi:hypothetical protein
MKTTNKQQQTELLKSGQFFANKLANLKGIKANEIFNGYHKHVFERYTVMVAITNYWRQKLTVIEIAKTIRMGKTTVERALNIVSKRKRLQKDVNTLIDSYLADSSKGLVADDMVIFVRLQNGNVHRVAASDEDKIKCLQTLRTKDGALPVSRTIEKITLT